MTASNQSSTTDKNSPDSFGRQTRDLRSVIIELAALRWREDDLDIEKVEEWGGLDGTFSIGSSAPKAVGVEIETNLTYSRLEPEQFDDRECEVYYSDQGVNLGVIAKGAEEKRAEATFTLEPADARQLAADLASASEELARRREVEQR